MASTASHVSFLPPILTFCGAAVVAVPVFRLLVGVQVVNGVLLPITLWFVWRLSASKEVMGAHRNGRTFNAVAALTVAATSALSLILLAVTVVGL